MVVNTEVVCEWGVAAEYPTTQKLDPPPKKKKKKKPGYVDTQNEAYTWLGGWVAMR